MLQLLTALKFLHSNSVLHHDLKLSNLLYNHRGELRVYNFGLAKRVDGEFVVGGNVKSGGGSHSSEERRRRSCRLTPKVVILWYRPPELLFRSEYYDRGVDNWGAGCVVGELLKGRPVILKYNPASRWSAEEALDSDYFLTLVRVFISRFRVWISRFFSCLLY